MQNHKLPDELTIELTERVNYPCRALVRSIDAAAHGLGSAVNVRSEAR